MGLPHLLALSLALVPTEALLAKEGAPAPAAASQDPASQDPASQDPASQDPTSHRLTTESPLGELLDNTAARAVLQAQLPLLVNAPQIDQARGITAFVLNYRLASSGYTQPTQLIAPSLQSGGSAPTRRDTGSTRSISA